MSWLDEAERIKKQRVRDAKDALATRNQEIISQMLMSPQRAALRRIAPMVDRNMSDLANRTWGDRYGKNSSFEMEEQDLQRYQKGEATNVDLRNGEMYKRSLSRDRYYTWHYSFGRNSVSTEYYEIDLVIKDDRWFFRKHGTNSRTHDVSESSLRALLSECFLSGPSEERNDPAY